MLPEIAALFFAGRTLLACLHCCHPGSCLHLTCKIFCVPGSGSYLRFCTPCTTHGKRNGMPVLRIANQPGQQGCRSGKKPGVQCCLFDAALLAGIDTTGHTGTWALYLLAQHPAVEARLAAELDAAELLVTAKRPHPRQLKWADLARLAYLQAVIKARPVLQWYVSSLSSMAVSVHLTANSKMCVLKHAIANACAGDGAHALAREHGPLAP